MAISGSVVWASAAEGSKTTVIEAMAESVPNLQLSFKPATRLLRYNIEEIGQSVRARPLANRLVSSSLAVGSIAFFAFGWGQAIPPIPIGGGSPPKRHL